MVKHMKAPHSMTNLFFFFLFAAPCLRKKEREEIIETILLQPTLISEGFFLLFSIFHLFYLRSVIQLSEPEETETDLDNFTTNISTQIRKAELCHKTYSFRSFL